MPCTQKQTESARSTWRAGKCERNAHGVDFARMVEEVLSQLVLVLDLNNLLRGADDALEVLDEDLAVLGELGGLDGGVVERVVERLETLRVRRIPTLAESLDDAIEANLAVNVNLLVLNASGRRDTGERNVG